MNRDADVYEFASSYASANGISLESAISELLRRSEHAPEAPSALLAESRRGLLVRAKQVGDRVITPEMLKEFSEDDLV